MQDISIIFRVIRSDRSAKHDNVQCAYGTSRFDPEWRVMLRTEACVNFWLSSYKDILELVDEENQKNGKDSIYIQVYKIKPGNQNIINESGFVDVDISDFDHLDEDNKKQCLFSTDEMEEILNDDEDEQTVCTF